MRTRGRRFQFSVRTLLLLPVAAAVLLALWSLLYPTVQHYRFLQALRRRGAAEFSGNEMIGLNLSGGNLRDEHLAYIAQSKAFCRLRTLKLSDTEITDAGLEHLAAFEQLEILWLGNNGITDGAVPQLNRVENLQHLSLSYTRVGNEGLRKLVLPRCRELDLAGARIDDDGLAALVAWPNLEWLNVSGCNITDKGARELAKLAHLKTLYLVETTITDAGVASLAELDGLEELHLEDTRVKRLHGLGRLQTLQWLCLDGTAVGDAAMKNVGELQGLRHLSLEGTSITDSGLRSVSGLARLEVVIVRDTKVTDKGMQFLQQALPRVTIMNTGWRANSVIGVVPAAVSDGQQADSSQ